ncbi:hypothetical protein L0Z36_05535 [Burkholderia multivorans]|uniref:hypothetical protein n=1 Tax=Burkholderia multivorans TaxID=87883 RepID=UPI00201A0A48|nr:hypothetical protein [Burkholderia multivorans]UQP01397.1 hypothetical protein L0Z36_05535 [Burkholderia multivorans]
MTVNTSTQSVTYDCDGSTTVFPIPFYFLLNEDIVAALVQDETDTDLVFGTDFNLSGAGDPNGGTLTMFVAPPTGYQLVITREVPVTQQTEYQQNDPFPAKTTEKALDKLTMICQQIVGVLGSLSPESSRALLLGRYDVNGAGAYRANGNRIANLGYPRSTTDAATLGAARDIAEQITSGVQGALGAFVQDGYDSVVRTFQSKMRNMPISAEDKGAVGDGIVNDTAKLQSVFDIASGRTVRLGNNKTYAITTLYIPPDVTLEMNGSKFRKIAPSETYAITGGLRLKADTLWLTSAGAATDNGIYLDGGSMSVDQIRIEYDNPGAGSSAGLENCALMIGPPDSAGTSVARDTIGKIYIKNHVYPVQLRNMRQLYCGPVQVVSYRRGVYVRNVQNSIFNGSYISGMAPGVQGKAGDNGLLIESTIDGGTQNLSFINWRVEDSGEHGYRLGGELPMRNLSFYSCSSIRPGSGANATGGCGFKAQGSRTTSYHYNIRLVDFVGEDGMYMGGNGAGIMFSLIDGFSVVNPILRKRANAQSFWHGLSIDEVSNGVITNPILLDCRQHCFRATANASAGFPQGMNDILLRGGMAQIVDGSTGVAISIDSFDDGGIDVPLKRFRIEGLRISGGYQAARIQPLRAGGSFTNCSMDFTYTDSTGVGGVIEGSDAWALTLRLSQVNLLIPAKRGSVQIIEGDATYTKNAIGWSAPPVTFQANLAIGAVLTYPVSKTSGMAMISTSGLAYYGQAFYRTNTPATVKMNGGPNFGVTTGALTGSTGTAGNMTFSVDTNNMYIENRGDTTQTVFVTIN